MAIKKRSMSFGDSLVWTLCHCVDSLVSLLTLGTLVSDFALEYSVRVAYRRVQKNPQGSSQ